MLFNRAWTCVLTASLMISGCHSGESDDAARADETETTSPKQVRRQNRLIDETSPYLLLHAHNPVDWYPWGPEAFAKAAKENKPIFLSIGYSSCYWCHVMERKVFTNEKIAKFMNENFVNIKVDREERPDVDDIYMTSLIVYFQLTGSRQGGGWPLSMFLTPNAKPFAGGTYFPPEDMKGPDGEVVRLGFATVMSRITSAWKDGKKQIEGNAELITENVRQSMKPKLTLTPVPLNRELVDPVGDALKSSHDSLHGGIDFRRTRPDSPKFPVPAKLALLQYLISGGDKQAEKVVYHSLDRISMGGIHDHLGGGFHRYSTDRKWHVPHFEKMLYDQSQLADVYLTAYTQTKNPLYRETVVDILDFVTRDLTERTETTTGAFFSALDAETEHIEGKSYVWEKEELKKVLGDDAKLFSAIYGVDQANPFEHGFVLHLPQLLAKAAAEQKLDVEQLKPRLAAMRRKLLAVRDKREAPLRDDKVLTSWNGLMIRAFANAGAVLNREDYVRTAENAAMFIMTKMRNDKKRLHRTYRAGKAKLNAYLDDYAFFVDGLLALHAATHDEKWLNAARRLTDQQIEHYWDETGNGFFFTAHDHEKLIARTKNAYDAVLPSGNSIAVRNLVKLASRTGDTKYLERAKLTLDVFAQNLKASPMSMTHMALALGEYLDAFRMLKPNEKTSSLPANGSTTINVISAPNTNSIQLVANESEDLKVKKAPARKPQPPKPVSAKAYLSTKQLPAGGKCRVAVVLTIKKGWHTYANLAGSEFFKPTVFSIESKFGTKLGKVTYPKGKRVDDKEADDVYNTYEDKVTIIGEISIPASAAGKTEELKLMIRHQACDHVRCLRPSTLVLNGKLKVAAVGKAVEPTNSSVFQNKKTAATKKK